jgi:hypothetical protein
MNSYQNDSVIFPVLAFRIYLSLFQENANINNQCSLIFGRNCVVKKRKRSYLDVAANAKRYRNIVTDIILNGASTYTYRYFRSEIVSVPLLM